jgi:hypothetical protein
MNKPSPVLLPPYFYAPTSTKLICLSLLSFGLYPAYWLYRYWQDMRSSGYSKVIPWLRVLFYTFLAFGVFRWIRRCADERNIAVPWRGWSVGLSAFAFLLLNIAWALPTPYAYFSLLNFIPVLQANQAAISVNKSLAPHVRPEHNITTIDAIVVVLGASYFAFMWWAGVVINRDLQILQNTYGISLQM